MERLWHLMRGGEAVDTLRLTTEQALDKLDHLSDGYSITPVNGVQEMIKELDEERKDHDHADH